jgi:hypothetical protein
MSDAGASDLVASRSGQVGLLSASSTAESGRRPTTCSVPRPEACYGFSTLMAALTDLALPQSPGTKQADRGTGLEGRATETWKMPPEPWARIGHGQP